MNAFLKLFIPLIVMKVLLIACQNTPASKSITVVTVEMSNAYNQVIFLERLGYFNQPDSLLDSVNVSERVQRLSFTIKDKQQNLYRLFSKDHRLDIILINDVADLRLNADYFDNGRFQFLQSPASISLHSFLSTRRQEAEKIREEQQKTLPDSLIQSKLNAAQQEYRNYVDTVSSAAAALYAYSAVDFGSDRDALKAFVQKLSSRFPDHSGIRMLAANTKEFMAIYENELQVGDKFPVIFLPDTAGALQNVPSPSPYLLVEFWASWEPRSRRQAEFDQKALKQFGSKGLNIVSISLDPEKTEWRKYIDAAGYTWPQLIDQGVWQGVAVKNYHFDSIPFNFLLNSKGTILAKAIYGDTLLRKLTEVIQ